MNEPTKVPFAKIIIRPCFYKSITHCTIKSYLKHFDLVLCWETATGLQIHLICFQLVTPNPLLDSTFVWLLILQPIHLLSDLMRVSFLALSSLSTPQTPHRHTVMLLYSWLSIFLFIPTEMSNEPQAAFTHQPRLT